MKKFLISNFKFLIFKKLNAKRYTLYANLGFSLIELLVVITFIGIIGTITSQVFIIGLRSQAKSEIIKEVKQNGDYASYVMETMIRNAIDIERSECNSNTQALTIISRDGFPTTFDCSGTSIASVSGVIPFQTVSLSLTSSRVKVKEGSCNFRVVCPTPPLSPKYVFITFKLSQTGVSLPLEQIASLDYQTTVSLRNYQ